MKTTAGRCCVFCGSPADSREHVFSKRLCKRAGAVRFPVISGVFTEGKGTNTRKPHYIEAAQTRHVCAKCNSTWMNNLESWFEERLGFLIEPRWPKLALPMIEALKPERNHLAHWLIKTAVMFNHACIKGELPIEFPPEITHKIKNGVIPENCWVDLAFSIDTNVGGSMTRCFRVVNGGKYEPSVIIENGDGFKFTVQFNHLLLRIAQAPRAKVTYESWRGQGPVRLYPSSSPKLPDDFTYKDIREFDNSVVLQTWLGCKGGIE